MKVSAINKKKGFTLIELMVVIAILAALAGIGYGPILDHMNDGDRVKATTNMASVHKVLLSFKEENGSFPCDATAARLQEKEEEGAGESSEPVYYGELTGDSSNAYFRQIFYKQTATHETDFYAPISVGGKSTKEGNKKVAKGKALEPGENAMAYVMKAAKDDDGGKQPVDTNDNPPLVICSVYPSKTPYAGGSIVLDNTSFRGHVFVLSTDGSVKDRKDDLKEDDDDDDKATFKDTIFPEHKGKDTTNKYIVLSPEL